MKSPATRATTLVRIPRILVLRARHHQRRPRADGGQQVVVAELVGQPGHGFEQQDAGAFAQARFEAADRAADAGEPASRIDGGMVQRGGTAVRMTRHAHARCIDPAGLQQHAQRPLRVVQAFAQHQQVAFQQAVTHGVVMLQPVVEIRRRALHRAASVFEGDGIRRQYGQPAARECRAEGLERVADDAGHLALAEMELAVVLVEDDHAAACGAPLRGEQEGRDAVAFEAAVFDPLPVEAVAGFDLAALEVHGYGIASPSRARSVVAMSSMGGDDVRIRKRPRSAARVDSGHPASSSRHPNPENPRTYLGLAYFTPEKFAELSPDEVKAIVSNARRWTRRCARPARCWCGHRSAIWSVGARCFPQAGKTRITDGPYTESKEVVGGLFIIEADSHDEALRIAAMHPAAQIGEQGGWAVELIPLDFYLAR